MTLSIIQMKLFAIIVAAILTSAAILYSIAERDKKDDRERALWTAALHSAMDAVNIVGGRPQSDERTAAVQEQLKNLREIIAKVEGKIDQREVDRAKFLLETDIRIIGR